MRRARRPDPGAGTWVIIPRVTALPDDQGRETLRHTLATVAYRAGKAVRDAPPGFAGYRPAPSSRTPAEILAHMGDLFDWAVTLAEGAQVWRDSTPLDWRREVERFFAALERFEAVLASEAPLAAPVSQLLQGPVADALTHIGQLTMLRRMAGSPIKGENYAKADIRPGRVGLDQTPPRREF